MDDISASSHVPAPQILDVDPVLAADEIVAEAEYEAARQAWLADPTSDRARDAARTTAAALVAARVARRADG